METNLNEAERLILELICSDSEITQDEMVEKSGFSKPSVQRYIKTLSAKGCIERVDLKRKERWKVLDDASPDDLNDLEQEILELIRSDSRITQTEIAARCGFSKYVIHSYIKTLSEKGCIVRTKSKSYGYWIVHDEGAV